MASVETQKISGTSQFGNSIISEDVRNSLEQIFSKIFTKEAYEQSTYFQPLLSVSHELPIDTIVKAPALRNILPDEELLRNAVLTSKSFIVSNDMVRSSVPVKLEQNTLILRDISSAAPSGDIVGIFTNAVCSNGQPCPSAQSVRSDMNDTWFVTFSSEENAKTALSAIKDCKYKDKIIRARLKTESSMKSYFSVPAGGNNPLQLAMDFSQPPPGSSGPNSVVSTPTARAGAINQQLQQQVPLSSSGASPTPIPGASSDGAQIPGQFGFGPAPAYGNMFFPAGYPVPPPHHQFMQQGGYPMPQHHQQQQQFTPQQQHMLMQHQQQQGSPFPSMPLMPVAPGSMLPMLTPQQMQQHQQQAFLYMQANPAAAAAYLAMQQQQQIGGAPLFLNPPALNGGMMSASPQQQNGKGNNNNNNYTRREGGKFNSNNGRGSQGGNGNYSMQGGRNNNGQFRQYNNNGQQQQQQRGPNGGFVNYSTHGNGQQQGPGGGPFIQRSYSADSQGNERQVFHQQSQSQQHQQQFPQSFNRSNIAPTIEVPLSSSAPPIDAVPVGSSDTSSDVTDASKQTGSSNGGSGASGSGGRSPKPRQTDGSAQPRQASGVKPAPNGSRGGNAAPGVDAPAGSRPSVHKDKASGGSADGANSSGEGGAKKPVGGDGIRPRPNATGAPRPKEGAASGVGKDKRSSTGANRDSRGPKRDEKSGAGSASQPSVVGAKKSPVIEFNMEADFPILVENEVGDPSVAKTAASMTASVWGLSNSVRKVSGNPAPEAPQQAVKETPSSSGREGGKGKGKNRDANKAPQVEAVPVAVVTAESADVQAHTQVPTKSEVVAGVEQRLDALHIATAEVSAAAVGAQVASVNVPAIAAAGTAIRADGKCQVSVAVPVVIPACIAAVVPVQVAVGTPVSSVPVAALPSAITAAPTAAAASEDLLGSPSSAWGAKKSFVDILRHASK